MSWDGLLLVNKPAGSTSHTVVQKVRERLHVQKAGHLGTLDPLATGLFPVCLGKATRLAPFYMKADKAYIAAIRFGFFTRTDDREGPQEGPTYKVKFTTKQLEAILSQLTGERPQKPPAYSAKKIAGKKAYEIARKGEQPAVAMQMINIYEIRLLNYAEETALIYIHSSSGTYVRSLARELGMLLKCGAHVHELERTRFGEFTLDQTCSPTASNEELVRSFIPIEMMLPHYSAVILNNELSKRITSGSAVECGDAVETEWARVFNEKKSLLAMAKVEKENDKKRLLPRIVFA